MSTEITSTLHPASFVCKTCDFTSSKRGDYQRHLLTRKHQKSTDFTQNYIACKCGNKYKDRSGLWRHSKKCNLTYVDDSVMFNKELFIQIMKQNEELHNSIIELSKEKSSGNMYQSNTSTNMNNNSFNLNFYLNEKCKDALNIDEFVSSIKLSLEDLENTGRRGYVEGITNIILKNLKCLEEHYRPVHCSDMKREVLYIKDNNKWEKEYEDKPILTKAIKVIANENIKKIKEWKDKYPSCVDVDSEKNNLYLKIVSNSMCGADKSESEKNIGRIITNLAKVTTIAKEKEMELEE